MNLKELIDIADDNISDIVSHSAVNNLSISKEITPNEKFGGWYGEGVSIIDGKTHKIAIRIPNDVIDGTMPAGSYDIKVSSISINRNGVLCINADDIRGAGHNIQDALYHRLGRFAKEHKLLKRKKRKLPSKINSMLCITSSNSGISGDILNNTGIKKSNIKIYKVGKASSIAKIIESNNKYDITVLYRGGHQDVAMNMFSEEAVLLAIGKAKKPVCVALGHDVDRPFVYNVADKEYSTPSSFAKSIHMHNNKGRRRKIILSIIIIIIVIYYIFY